jgi:hypothetical protein
MMSADGRARFAAIVGIRLKAFRRWMDFGCEQSEQSGEHKDGDSFHGNLPAAPTEYCF